MAEQLVPRAKDCTAACNDCATTVRPCAPELARVWQGLRAGDVARVLASKERHREFAHTIQGLPDRATFYGASS